MQSLRDKLEKKKFVVTAELEPPKGPDVSGFITKAHIIKEWVDGVNVTDNQRATLRLSSAAGCTILEQLGIESIFQVTSRDRNRLAIQSDLLGISSLGIRNVLAISGDYPTLGDHPGAKTVYDVDSVHILEIISLLNQGLDMKSRPLQGKTNFFPGAVFNPNVDMPEAHYFKLRLKVERGARFFQTQIFYDIDKFRAFVDKFDKFGIDRSKIYILAGVLPLKSAKNAVFINKNVPGVDIPDETISRLEASDNSKQLGLEIAAEMINKLKGFCEGVHIMTIGKEEILPSLLELAGFSKGLNSSIKEPHCLTCIQDIQSAVKIDL